MKELIERLKRTEYDDLDACKAADALERMAFENLRLAGEVSNRNSRALAGDTATKQFDAMYEDIESLTAERDSLKEGLDALRADAERYRFICDCNNDQALDLLSERVGQRAGLTELVDALVAEIAGEKT